LKSCLDNVKLRTRQALEVSSHQNPASIETQICGFAGSGDDSGTNSEDSMMLRKERGKSEGVKLKLEVNGLCEFETDHSSVDSRAVLIHLRYASA
jgi:hypothetical protein